MPSKCPKCGSAIGSQEAVCPSCGTNYRSVGSKSQQQQQVAYVKQLSTGKRPMLANVYAGLSVIGAVGAFLTAASYKFIPSVSALATLASDFKALSGAMPYFLAVVGIISLGAAFGFFKGSRWAWKVGLAASALEIITIIAPNLLGLFVGIITLFFMSRSPVKSWLRK